MTQEKPVRLPFVGLVDLIRKVVVFDDRFPFDVYDLTAVCVRETYNSPLWCACNSLDKSNLQAVCVGANVRADDFLAMIRIREGKWRQQIPRFRFEANWLSIVQAAAWYGSLGQVDKAVFSCSFGIAQKSAYYLTRDLRPESRWLYLQRFMGDLDMQLRQLYKDLCAAYRIGEPCKLWAFSRYNGGPGADRSTPYGLKVADLAQEIREKYATIDGGKS